MAKVILMAGDGSTLGELPRAAEDILARAEEHARAHHLAKRSYFPIAIRQEIEAAGYHVADTELTAAMAKLDAVRRGEQVEGVPVRVTHGVPGGRPAAPNMKGGDMADKPPAGHRFFEAERSYPNAAARAWYDRLVGLDGHKRQLLLELELLLYPNRLAQWSRKHHGVELRACQIMAIRTPLVLLEGDVGCGKTALAETIGDPLAEMTGGKVHLLKVNTQVRGTGMVGEMTDLIVQAFAQAEARADRLKGEPVLLLIDEADALAARRDEQHMHHEDKAGLNTLLQRIDGLRLGGRRIAVIFITNRPEALDPAVRRRAALRLTFGRPDDAIRAEIIRQSLPELGMSRKETEEIVVLTGPGAEKNRGVPFTASDMTERLLPAALRAAYAAGRPLTGADLLEQARVMEPTLLMGGRDGTS
jgi:AAA+ superfamily predicted ATPase